MHGKRERSVYMHRREAAHVTWNRENEPPYRPISRSTRLDANRGSSTHLNDCENIDEFVNKKLIHTTPDGE